MKPTDLLEHPEGGRFREIFRSGRSVHTPAGTVRPAMTHIYFSLNPGEVSRFHRVSSDEVWNLYQGEGIRLYTWNGTDSPVKRVTLSVAENRFCHVVPAGTWQAAEPLSDTVLAGCTVAPGFEFADFELLEPQSVTARFLIDCDPEMRRLIHPGGARIDGQSHQPE